MSLKGQCEEKEKGKITHMNAMSQLYFLCSDVGSSSGKIDVSTST